jgi:A/G-specific adenine glycosylase
MSEIILQQTQVNQGIHYYNEFIKCYPDIKSLADASEQEILKLWQGLGYYSRARNLHTAANQLIIDFNGKFPADYGSLRKLKGVGPYTASAIASIAFGVPLAVVDGNVERVISRLFSISEPVNSTRGRKIIQQLASELLDPIQPSDHNQAMMEFGALQCVPLNPNCQICPLKEICSAFKENAIAAFPVKIKKIKTRKRYFSYFIFSNASETYIRQRKTKDIWQQMYEFPMLEHEDLPELSELEKDIEKISGLRKNEYKIGAISEPYKHQLSHQLLYARFIHVRIISKKTDQLKDWKKIKWKDLTDYPIPRLLDKYLESNISKAG